MVLGVIRLAVRVAREHAELVLAELAELAPGRPGGARRRRRHGRVRDLRRAGRAARRSATCARRRAARSSTSRRPSSPTTGTSAGATGTGRVDVGGGAARAPAVGAGRAPGALDVVDRARRRRSAPARTPTTRLSLELLAELEPAGALADWGCGSGVLAIAAAKLGFAPVLGVRRRGGVGRGHARRRARPTASTVEVSRCDLRRAPGPWAPTVTANLVRPLLLEVAARMERAAASG